MCVWQKQHGGVSGENRYVLRIGDEGSTDTLTAHSVFVGLLRKKFPRVALMQGGETGL